MCNGALTLLTPPVAGGATPGAVSVQVQLMFWLITKLSRAVRSDGNCCAPVPSPPNGPRPHERPANEKSAKQAGALQVCPAAQAVSVAPRVQFQPMVPVASSRKRHCSSVVVCPPTPACNGAAVCVCVWGGGE